MACSELPTKERPFVIAEKVLASHYWVLLHPNDGLIRAVPVPFCFQGLLRRGCGGLIDQNTIDNSLPYFVVVRRLWLNIFRTRVEGFAALAFGDILAIVDLAPKLLLKCYRTHQSSSNPLPSAKLATSWTRSLSRATRFH